MEYEVSLISQTAYIASINITDDTLRGMWTMVLQSQGSYSIQILGNTELQFTSTLYKIDPSNVYGFSTLEGKPSHAFWCFPRTIL